MKEQRALTVPAGAPLSAAQMDVMLLPALFSRPVRTVSACVAKQSSAVLLNVVVVDWLEEEL